MTRFLASDTNPDGFKLEELLLSLRRDVVIRACVCTTGRVSDELEPRYVANWKTAFGGELGVRSAQRGEGAIESREGIGGRGRHKS